MPSVSFTLSMHGVSFGTSLRKCSVFVCVFVTLAWPAARPNLVMLDISHGKEPVRIPMFNDIDEDKPPSQEQLQYLRYPCIPVDVLC